MDSRQSSYASELQPQPVSPRPVELPTISGYRITEQLHESANSVVYRGQRLNDNHAVVLKLLRGNYPAPERIAGLRREFDLLHQLKGLPGIVQVYGLEYIQQRWVLCLEDFGGESLVRLGLAGRLNVDEVLALALQIVPILGQLHQRQLMHKDINPANVVYNPVTRQAKLIDFGIATLLSREMPTFRNPNVLEGTLAYMSPEQTGRMNRSVDYRTDFYSLGVTLYELFTGQLPFDSADALELVHSHIARQPVPLHEHNPAIPTIVSEIVLKLMAKNAEERYQSVYGLRADLEACRELLKDDSDDSSEVTFVPGARDVSERLMIPQKLYGREGEVERVLAAFERVSRGASELLLLSGSAGIGKSALVHEMYKPVTRQRGYFITGKYDQLQRDIPYAGLAGAFRSLLRQVLTENEAQIVEWRTQLLDAMGPNGQLLIDNLPELELIIGAQPAVLELPPTEARNRLNLVFQNFIQVFAQPEHPLVIFLDDLQWADSASLRLMERLLLTLDSHNLLIIGTYRTNEVPADHPLRRTLSALREAGAPYAELVLAPLTIDDVTLMVADTLQSEPERVASLAQLVAVKTGGNPFFVGEFLRTLATDGLLHFAPGDGVWYWDEQQIQAHDLTDNVVDLMMGRVQRLSEQTRAVLKFAACVGNRFDLRTLAAVTQQSPVETARHLEEALIAGLLLPLNDTYKLMTFDIPGLASHVSAEYRFAHDRIQQAVYELITATSRPALHWQVGLALLYEQLGGTPIPPETVLDWLLPPDIELPAGLEEQLFSIANQLNQGQICAGSQPERDALATLNLYAGQRAKAAAAYDQAYYYLANGVSFLGADGWERYYNLTLQLHVHAAAAAYLSGDLVAMQKLTEEVLQYAKSLFDKIDIYEIRTQAYAAQRQFAEAIQTTLPALQLLGIELPAEPTQADVGTGITRVQQLLTESDIERLKELPPVTDAQILATMRILSSLFSVAYVAASPLMPLVICEQVVLSLQHGTTAAAPFAYANYGLIMGGMIGDIATGIQFGQLAIELLEKLDDPTFKAKTLVTVNFFITGWSTHIRTTLQPLLDGYRAGLEAGDFEFAGYAAYMHTCHSFLIGRELDLLDAEFAANDETFARLTQERTRQQNGLYWQVVSNLRTEQGDPLRISGAYYREAQALPLLQASNDVASLANYHYCKMLLAVLFGDYVTARAQLDQMEPYLGGLTGSMWMPLFYFYDSLVQLTLFDTASVDLADLDSETERPVFERVAQNQSKLEQWATFAPANLQHKYQLVAAEMARVCGDEGQARVLYDRAIAGAQTNGYLNEAALANERAGHFYRTLDLARIAAVYFYEAHYAYTNWGAIVKAMQLETLYPTLALAARDVLGGHTLSRVRITTTDNTSENSARFLDIDSLIKASQALSGEIVLETLLRRLMHTVLENAGAERGILLRTRNNLWTVEAEGNITSADVKVLQSVPLATADVPQSVVYYVARTSETVVLSDALQAGPFAQDSYIVEHQPRSLLCMPLQHQGTMTGMIYLENRQLVGAFTSDRLELLHLLSGQVAISIENASFYAHLEDLVEERTVELSKANETLLELNTRLQSEMNLAHNIQRGLLPPSAPNWPSLDVACHSEPAREVGGDLYAYHQLTDQRHMVAVGDVSGKGMPAALLMAVTVATFRTTIDQGLTPAAFLAQMDTLLADYTRTTRQNCAMVYVELLLDDNLSTMDLSGDAYSGERWIVRAANAGCVSPLVKYANGSVAWFDIGGIPLGFRLGARHSYPEVTAGLRMGDMLILTSDGVVEATNATGELFGLERLEEAVRLGPQSSAQAMLAHLLAMVQAYIGTTEPHDDVTIVVVRI